MATTRFENISSFAAAGSDPHVVGIVAGDGALTTIRSTIPQLAALPQVLGTAKVAVDSGNGVSLAHGLALSNSGVVTEWGSNWGGVMPARVNGDGPVEDIAAGFGFSLFLRDGAVGVWGLSGFNSTLPTSLASPSTYGARVVSIFAQGEYACALREDGSVTLWGRGAEYPAAAGFPGGVTHLAMAGGSVGILSGGSFYKRAITGGAWTRPETIASYGINVANAGFANLWGGWDRFVLRNSSARPDHGDHLYGEGAGLYNGAYMPADRTGTVSQVYAVGAQIVALTNDGAVWSSLAGVGAGPIHAYAPAAAVGGAAASLDLKLADCTALFEGAGTLGGALFGFENIAPNFVGGSAWSASLASGGAVVLEPAFLGTSGFAVKSSAIVQVSNLLQVYTGAALAATVSTIPEGLQASVVVKYNGSTARPVAAGSYQVDAVLDTADYFGVASGQLVVERAGQTINWQALQDRKLGEAPFPLFASASSGLAIAYASSDSQLATVAGNMVTLRGAGQVTLTAYQQGGTNYTAAVAVTRTLLISALPPVISNAQGATVLGVGQNFFFQFKASNTPTQWLLTPDTILPPGFLFNPSAGTLAGTGIESGIWRVGVIARNSAGDSAPNEFTFGIFDAQTVDVVKKATINTDSWDVSFPDAFAGVNGAGAAVGQLRYGDEVTFRIFFVQGVAAVGAATASTNFYDPPLVQARFSLKGLDTEPAFLVTGESEFKKITSYSPSGYTNEIYITVSLKNDALLAFLSDFEADAGTHATCIGEFELVFRRPAKAGGGLDTISTRPFSMRVTRGLF